MNTKTITKPVAIKSASKAAPKVKPEVKAAQKAKPKTLPYRALLAECLAAKFGEVIQRFYVSALAYHKKEKTTFPRGRLVGEPLLNPDEALAFIEKHKVASIPSGSKAAQRFFDQMMVETNTK
ncbi:MAG TPA: hypothetical protein VLA25_04345 [Methylotenera sp.]|nr:hypothetical protein [Methylotenera sp.]